MSKQQKYIIPNLAVMPTEHVIRLLSRRTQDTLPILLIGTHAIPVGVDPLLPEGVIQLINPDGSIALTMTGVSYE